jgi:GntR family transcriptional repressor for pyruvate dehydrogenase complex
MTTQSVFLDRDSGLPQKLAAQIRGQIFAKRLMPGGKLPTERELGLTYGVARSVVREALTILAAQGILRSRQGGGVYIRETLDDSIFDAATLVLPVPPDALQDLMAVRISLEPTAAELTASNATAEERLTIEAAARELHAVKDLGAKVDVGIAFHLAIARASHNPILNRIIASLLNLYVASHRITLGTERGAVEGALAHDEIWDAIKAANPSRARRAMLNHLRETESLLKATLATTKDKKSGPRRKPHAPNARRSPKCG